MKPIDQFIHDQPEPEKSVFVLLRSFIPTLDQRITEEWKYKLPFFYFKGKMFCYLWKDKITSEPYIGIIKGNHMDHPLLEKGKRKKMKIFRINPNEDIRLDLIEGVLREALTFYD